MSTISIYILNTTILGYVATLKVRAISRDPDNTAFFMFCNNLLLLLPTNSFIVTSRSLDHPPRTSMMMLYSRGDGGGGWRYSSEFLVGVCRPVSQILTQFQTKIFHFPHPFSDLVSKIHTRCQTFVVSKLNFASITNSRIDKFSSIDIFWILLFLYYSFGVEKTNTFIRSCRSLENHSITRFKTLMVKISTRFRTNSAQKPYPLVRHIPI